ncbi:hypothetical protein [Helicobacter suis]|uniref:hypothetical protein n=1 Tax=Helicobacter suis TaxID=104628 RepID=UPI0013D890F2|nr:hypothetical protein [Helicobacter suis]
MEAKSFIGGKQALKELLENHGDLLEKDKREITNQLGWSIIKESGPEDYRKKVFQALLLYFLASPIFDANEIEEGWITKLGMSGNDVMSATGASLFNGMFGNDVMSAADASLFNLTDIELSMSLQKNPVTSKIMATFNKSITMRGLGTLGPRFYTLQGTDIGQEQMFQMISQMVSQDMGMDQEQMTLVLFQALSQVIPQEIGIDKERLSKFLSTSRVGKMIGVLSGLPVGVDDIKQLLPVPYLRRELFGKDNSRREALVKTLQTEAYDFGKLVCLACTAYDDLFSFVDKDNQPLKCIGEALYITRTLKLLPLQEITLSRETALTLSQWGGRLGGRSGVEEIFYIELDF